MIQISNVCYLQGTPSEDSDDDHKEEDLYFYKNVFMLPAVTGARLAASVSCSAPGRPSCALLILTGYKHRQLRLALPAEPRRVPESPHFGYLGRERTRKSQVRGSSFSSRAYGSNKSADISS